MGKEIEYVLSSPIRALPDYKIENRKSFILSASDEEQPYVIKRESLDIFNVRERDLAAPNVKKFFY